MLGTVRRTKEKRSESSLLLQLAIGWLALVIAAALFADLLPLPDPEFADPSNRLLRPLSPGAILGTDALGRDVFSRVVYGARVSMVVGVAAVGVGIVVGGSVGVAAGYIRGWFDRIATFFSDLMLSFPALVLILAVLTYVGRSVAVLIGLIAMVSIPQYMRIARANSLTSASKEYVLSAVAIGAKPASIIRREIVPNVAVPLASYALLAVATVIIIEGSLSFLGLGVPPPAPTWGGMIADGRRQLQSEPYLTLIPAAVMSATVLSLNVVGDTARSRIDRRVSRL
jgi:peptide/nickel transport system permease protein